MRVTVLGSGTVDPRPHRASTGFVLEVGDRAIIVDLGAGTLRNGQLAGLPMADIGTVVLTHFHPDHTSDLVPFLFARKHAPERWKQSPPLSLYGPPGTREFLHKLFEVWPSIEPEDDRLEVFELTPGEDPCRLEGGVHLQAFRAVHGDMKALCYRFESLGSVVAFSGDTALCPGVIEAARNADLFFCECACYPRGVEPLQCREVHLSWEDVAEICEVARPRKLILTHLYELVLARKPDPRESLAQALTIPVELGSDRAIYETE
jgi:ribonuclease BN (tRNA processing enzyme)